jgi:predicted O-methyltransferase YrrM
MSEAPKDLSQPKSYWRNPNSFKFEANPRWAAVDEYNWKHLHAQGKPDAALMDKILNGSKEAGLPPIAVAPAHGKFLQLQARMMGARTIVEVGMLGGYSTVWLASSHPDVKVTSIEIDQEYADVAKKHFEEAGVTSQIEVRIGSGMDVLPQLVQEFKDGKRPALDMAFIDANKTNNLDYFNYCLEMSRPGTVIVVDNVVRMGGVVDESRKDDPNIQGTKRLIEGVGKDSRVDATILQVVGDKNYDGFLTAVVR